MYRNPLTTKNTVLKCELKLSVLPVLGQSCDSDKGIRTVCGYPQDWVLCQRMLLYTHSTDKRGADFHCLELNKVLKSRGNPVG